MLQLDVKHPRWYGVEVITCVSGGRYVNVMDFPVFHLFRASTPLPVHNLCENHEWDGMHMRLRFYRNFLEKHLEDGAQRRLFIVSDGMEALICFRAIFWVPFGLSLSNTVIGRVQSIKYSYWKSSFGSKVY